MSCSSVRQLCLTLCNPMDMQASLSITNSQNLLRLMSTQTVMPSNHLISVVPFSSYLQSYPASESFPVSQFFTSGGQRIRASASVLPMNIQDWFSLGLTGLIALLSKGLSRVFSSTTIWNYQFFGVQPSLWSNSYILEKTVLTIWTFVGKVMSLLLNMLCRFCHSFSNKEQASFNFMGAVIICSDFGDQENKVCHCFHCFLVYLQWSDGPRCHHLRFLNVEF